MTQNAEKTTDAQLRHELLNGGGQDLATQSRALERILARVAQLPTVDQVMHIVNEALSIHATSCASARAKPAGVVSKLKLGKGEVEGSGWGVAALVAVTILATLVLALAIPHAAQWLAAWKGTP